MRTNPERSVIVPFVIELLRGVITRYSLITITLLLGMTTMNAQWVIRASGAGELRDVHLVNDSVGFAVGMVQDQTIWKTTDGGIRWFRHPLMMDGIFLSISFPDDSTGIVWGDDNVAKTRNVGASWYRFPHYISGESRILFATRSLAYAVVTTGGQFDKRIEIRRSTDGGVSWTDYVPDSPTMIAAPTPMTAYAGITPNLLGPRQILKTTNGGASWTGVDFTSDLDRVKYYRDMHFGDVQSGIMVGSQPLGQYERQATAMYTTNGGVTWEEGAFPERTPPLIDVYMPTRSVAYATGLGGAIVKSTDGGRTWLMQCSGTVDSIVAVHFEDELHGSAITVSGMILTTTNGGEDVRAAIDLGADTVLCAGETLRLSIPFDGFSTHWSTGATSREIVVSESGVYSVRILDRCGHEVADTIVVTVLPPMTLSFVGPDSAVDVGTAITFVNQSSGAAQWIWSFGDGTLDTTFSPVHQFDASCRECNVTLYAYQNDGTFCRQCMTVSVRVNTQTDPEPNPEPPPPGNSPCMSTIRVLPNPIRTDYVDIAFDAIPQGSIALELYDEIGRRLLVQDLPAGASVYRLDISGVGSGAHFLRLSCGTTEVLEKLFVEH